jgi:heterogeneous nuclear ribonucleoprotein A/B/D
LFLIIIIIINIQTLFNLVNKKKMSKNDAIMYDQQRQRAPNQQAPFQQKHDFSDKSIAARKIFVGGLTWDTTKEHLIEYFSKFGKIEDVNIKIDLNTGRSRGFGFILFESKEVADKILNIKEHIINGKPIDPKPAKHKSAQEQQQQLQQQQQQQQQQSSTSSTNPVLKKIFVGGLDPSVPESDIRDYFSKYGRV